MRTKTRGVRAKASKIPSLPNSLSTRSVAVLNQEDGDELFSTHSSDEGRNNDVVSDLIGKERVVLPEKRCGDGSQDVVGGNCMDTDWLEKGTCILCNEGGQLLVCSEIECPIAIHEKCMSGKPQCNDIGNFYCPYCAYKLAQACTKELRRKAMLAKEALSTFIDGKVVGGSKQEQHRERSAKTRERIVSSSLRDKNFNDNENRLDHNEVQSSTSNEKSKRENLSKADQFENGSEDYDSDCETLLQKQRRVKQRTEITAQPQCFYTQSKSLFELEAIPEETARTRSEKFFICKRSPNTVDNPNKKPFSAEKSRQHKDSAKLFTHPLFPNARRKKLFWSAEEEDMLREGVQKFSTTINKNLPWKKILEYGCRVFDKSRNPSDLKDKWKSIMSRES